MVCKCGNVEVYEGVKDLPIPIYTFTLTHFYTFTSLLPGATNHRQTINQTILGEFPQNNYLCSRFKKLFDY